MCRRCVCWCQRNICVRNTVAHALVPKTPVLECTQHQLQKNAHTYIHTHMCICIHMHKNTHAHLWHHPHTLKNSYWNTQPMHTHAYTYIFTCICMHTYTHIYTHAYIYIYTCQYTYIHAHIYTRMYNIYICMHASKSETTERHWLCGKPNLTPRSSAHLLGWCIPEGGPSPWPAAQLPVQEEQQISAEQPQQTVAHHTITIARHPNYNSSSALVRSRFSQFVASQSCEPQRRTPNTGLRF